MVLASQPVPFLDLPFAQRFDTTLASFGWPADAFWTLLHDHDPTEIARRTTGNGKTALHWAVTHFGTFLRESSGTSDAFGSPASQSYAELASELISMGADVHAVWYDIDENIGLVSSQGDPFLCFLGGIIFGFAVWSWDKTSIARAADRWGQMLVDGGISLPHYVEAENRYLGSRQSAEWRIPSYSYSKDGWRLVPRRLLVSEETTLLLEVIDLPSVDTWKEEAAPMPGTWPMTSALPDTIIWVPEDEDSRDGMCWVWGGCVYMTQTSHELATLETTRKPLGIDDLLYQARRREMQGIQDDHGLVSLCLGQRREPCQQADTMSNRRRASSSPPSLRFSEYQYPPERYLITQKINIHTPSGYRFATHKCPFDSRWRMCRKDQKWRSCMRGQCQEGLVPFTWGEHPFGFRDQDGGFEGWFLSNEDYARVARRYAEKFCPERMHIVDRAQERATQRAQLAMGPRRKEDMAV